MKNLKFPIIGLFVLSVILTACKKDDSDSTTVVNRVRGNYFYNNSNNVQMLRWGAGGAEIPISEAEKAEYIANINLFTEDGYYNFVSDTMIYFVDTVNNTTDSSKYKIVGNIIYLDLRDNPFFGDYYPIFKVSGNTLISNCYYVEIKDQNGSSSTFIQTVDNFNLLDSVLAERGYSSVADLKANEELSYNKYVKNYTKR